MLDLNRVFILGRVNKEPAKIIIRSGASITTFAISTAVRVGSRQQIDSHPVVAYGQVGDSCAKHLVKGMEVCVEGRIQYRMVDKANTPNVRTEIIAERVQFMDSPGEYRQAGAEKDEGYGE